MALEAKEQGNLIGSDKVEGTAVYGADRTKVGSIERVMIDKMSGKVSYAVLSFGGFLGIGDDHYPLPWQSLKYDTSLGGYLVGITESQLKSAPKYGNDNAWNWDDRATPPSLAQAAAVVPGAVIGGLHQWRTLRDGTPDAAVAEAKDAVAQTNGRGLIVGPGCVLPMNTPDANVAAVVRELGGPLKPLPGVQL